MILTIKIYKLSLLAELEKTMGCMNAWGSKQDFLYLFFPQAKNECPPVVTSGRYCVHRVLLTHDKQCSIIKYKWVKG
jgi:hypothetical protein